MQIRKYATMYTLDRSATHPKFNATKIRMHDLQILDIAFYALRWST